MAKELNILLPLVLFLPLLVPLIFIVAGCSKNSEPNQPLLSATPDVLDFGKVRPTDSPIKLTLDVCNNSDKDIVVTDILSCCGCTVIDVPTEPILPHEKVTVTVSVNVWGRSGLFENDLIVKTVPEFSLRVPIRGTIETDIWTDGQALRCTIAPKEQRTSTILTVYTAKYPDIVFVEGQEVDGVTLTELSRVAQSGETAIRFSIDVDVEPNSIVMRTIKIVPADSSIAPLTIPFYCHREE
jgi:hypothetical protein